MAKRKKRLKKKFNVKARKEELHELWSRAVRQRDRYVCQWCAHDGKHNVNTLHHGHHIVARSLCGNNGAFDVDNGMTLCFHCHIDRLKAEPDEYIKFRDEWVQANLGIDYFTMRDKYRPFLKFTEEFYDTKRDSLEYVLKQTQG
jgi:hypothetical protein